MNITEHNEIVFYTGLEDRNGNEIYEGDIVILEWQQDKGIGQIEFVHGCFKVTKMKRFVDIPLFLKYPIVEVIGSIYENPELLKQG